MSTAPPATTDEASPRLAVIIGGLMLVLLLAALDSTIVATALPTIVGDLGGLQHIAWVVTAYLLAQTVVMPIYGKLGDLYGRKVVLQAAIVIFLVGSALCGISQSMPELIAFRAIQGLGGGGLVVTTQAALGDVVSPRERGRYSGLFGAVFGVASVAGPLLGGFLTGSLSWRWIFYINIPFGILALVVLGLSFPGVTERVQRSIDWLGALLLAGGLTALVLFTSLGGNTLAWGSPEMIALAGLGLVMLSGFVWADRRASEPVLPLRLFRNRVFSVTSAVGLIVGFALIGSVTFLPLFQQVVKGLSPTQSGLQLIPLMGGVLVASIASGQIISRRGRYRIFPIAGTGLTVVGLLMLSQVGAGTSETTLAVEMLVVGLGLGMVMQVLVLAVQNAVDYEDLGVATSGASLFRSIGGSLGTAVLGAVFTAQLTSALGSAGAGGAQPHPGDLAALPPALRSEFVHAYADSLGTVFLVAAGVAAVGFLLSWFIIELPLRETVATAGVGEAFASPRDSDSLDELARGLSALLDRETRRRATERIAARAGVPLDPVGCWVLARLNEDPAPDVRALAPGHSIETGAVEAALSDMRERELVDGDDRLTASGRDAAARLIAVRRATLSELLRGWEPEAHADIARFVALLSRELAAEAPAGGNGP